MLMTGLVLGQLRTVGVQRLSVTASNTTGEAAARDFYEGINQFLAGGVPDSFLAELDSDFVDHTELIGGEGSAEDLQRYLSSLRSTFPGLRFTIDNLLVRGESVAVDLSLTGDFSGTFAGVEASAEDARGGFERLRVVDDRIAERWGSRDLPPMYETLLEFDGPDVSVWPIEPHFERHRLDPKAAVELDTSRTAVILAEAGTLGVAADEPFSPAPAGGASYSTNQPAEAAGDNELAIRLEPGQLLVAPPWSSVRIWNPGNEPASLLFVVMRRVLSITDYPGPGQETFQTRSWRSGTSCSGQPAPALQRSLDPFSLRSLDRTRPPASWCGDSVAHRRRGRAHYRHPWINRRIDE